MLGSGESKQKNPEQREGGGSSSSGGGRRQKTCDGHYDSLVIIVAGVFVLVAAIGLPVFVALYELLEVGCALGFLDERMTEKIFGMGTLHSAKKSNALAMTPTLKTIRSVVRPVHCYPSMDIGKSSLPHSQN